MKRKHVCGCFQESNESSPPGRFKDPLLRNQSVCTNSKMKIMSDRGQTIYNAFVCFFYNISLQDYF